MRAAQRLGLAWALGTVAWPATAQGQGVPPSREYLFVTSVDDARAVWVNPAGLGWVPEASVLAEVGLARSAGSVWLDQYTLGLNSRGLGLAYQRDRSRDSVSIGVFRIGLGLPVGRGSIGAAMTNYRGTREQGFDLGLRYPALRVLDVGLVVRDVGRPQVAPAEPSRPVTGVLGATWTIAPTLASLSAEAIAVERPGLISGFDVAYRGGFTVRTSRPWPLALHATAQMGSDGSLRRWSIGVLVGGLDRVGVVTTAAPTTGLGELQWFSAVGVASRRAQRP